MENGAHSQDTDCNANIIYTELGPLLLRKWKMEITVASEPPPKRPIIQAMAEKSKDKQPFCAGQLKCHKKVLIWWKMASCTQDLQTWLFAIIVVQQSKPGKMER